MARHEFWTDLLSEHLDGTLSDEQARAVDEHLAGCRSCRTVAAELAEVRRRARALGGIAPPGELWPRIRARLDDEADVVDLTLRLGTRLSAQAGGAVDHPRRWPGWRAVATVALMVATGAAGWGLRGSIEGSAGVGPSADEAARFASTETVAGPEGLAEELASLEEQLAHAPAGVSVATVELLRKNLGVIRAAIAESREALAVDPENVFVQEHLEGAVARQRAFLLQASSILAADD